MKRIMKTKKEIKREVSQMRSPFTLPEVKEIRLNTHTNQIVCYGLCWYNRFAKKHLQPVGSCKKHKMYVPDIYLACKIYTILNRISVKKNLFNILIRKTIMAVKDIGSELVLSGLHTFRYDMLNYSIKRKLCTRNKLTGNLRPMCINVHYKQYLIE